MTGHLLYVGRYMPVGCGACVRASSRRVAAAHVLLGLLVVGCAAPRSQITVVDHRALGDIGRYRESFEEGYFDIDDHGNVDLVLVRRAKPGGASAGVSQVLHVRSFWRPIPGRTVAGSTQINAVVTYAVSSGQAGTAFEGGGSIFFSPSRDGQALTGSLERAVVHPRRRLAAEMPIFERAELSGRFVARRDPRRVTEIVNELHRLFGPRSE